MDRATRGPMHDRLRLAESLLRAVEESVPPLQRLLSEVTAEIQHALREGETSAHEGELLALRCEVEQLREGLTSRAVIERAKGILMQGHELTESQAFALLNELSQRQHRKLREVAADIASDSAAQRPAVVEPGTSAARLHAASPPRDRNSRSGPPRSAPAEA